MMRAVDARNMTGKITVPDWFDEELNTFKKVRERFLLY